ncbi:MAG: spore germination protein [Firmicutes bacterium]|nr:spore germination protein [Bacillota bacterium]
MISFPRVSMLQFFIICFISAFGVSMTTLPGAVADAAKEDMWLTVVVGGVIFLFTFWTATKLASYFPQNTCIEYHRIILGPVLGEVVNVFLVVLLATVPIVSIRSFVVALKIYLLDLTPNFAVIVVLMVFFIYATQYGLFPIIRMQQIIFMSFHMLFLMIVLLGLLSIKTINYLPFLAQGFIPVLKGAIPSWYAYVGPEFAVGFFYPFISMKNQVLKWGLACIAVLTGVYTLITLIVQGILGSADTAHNLVPTIIAYRSVEIPDTFIERLDGYFFIFWIPVFTACMLIWVYFVSSGIKQILKLEYNRPIVVLVAPFLVYFVIVVPNFQTAQQISQWVNYAFLAWGLGILPILLTLAWWKEKRRNVC